MSDSAAGNDKAELKRLMKAASSHPVHMAMAIGADGKPIMRMDKTKNAKALEKMIRQESPAAKDLRFGTVSVDPAEATEATFMLNKPLGGAARKLAAFLRPAGISKVHIVLEDGTAAESAAGEDDAAARAAGHGHHGHQHGDHHGHHHHGHHHGHADAHHHPASEGPKPASSLSDADIAKLVRAVKAGLVDVHHRTDGPVAVAPAQPSLDPTPPDKPKPVVKLSGGDVARLKDALAAAGAQGGPPPAAAESPAAHPAPVPPPPGAGPGTPTPAVLTKELTGLVKRVMAVVRDDPGQQVELSRLAIYAQAAIRAGDLDGAAAAMGVLAMALDDAGDRPPAAPGAHGRAYDEWLAERRKIEASLDTHREEAVKAGVDPAHIGDLHGRFLEEAGPVLARIEEDLAALKALRDSLPGELDARKAAVKGKLDKAKAWLEGNVVAKMIDQLPGHPVGLVTGVLGALSKVGHALHLKW